MEAKERTLKNKFLDSPLVYLPVIAFIHCLYYIAIPVVWIKDKHGLRKYNKEMARESEAQAWVIAELRRQGFQAEIWWAGYACAEVSADRIAEFRAVYRDALKNFPNVRPAVICAGARPEGLLDKVWAASVGIAEYQAPQMTAPCLGCGKQFADRFRWGNDEFHKELYVCNYSIVIRPEYKHLLTGRDYICRDCEPSHTMIERSA